MKLITKYLKPHALPLLLCILLLLVQVVCNLTLPGQMSELVDTGIVAMNGQAGQQSMILGIGVRMLLVSLLGVAAAVLVGYGSAKILAAVTKRMRRDVFVEVENFPQRSSTASPQHP